MKPEVGPREAAQRRPGSRSAAQGNGPDVFEPWSTAAIELPMVENRHERYAETGEGAVPPPLAREFTTFLVRPKTP
jgi:hypothetical protein